MTQPEFLARAAAINGGGATITNEDYKVVEYVYNFHPAIKEVGGKDQIAELWVHFGMRVIRDMVPTAKRAEELEAQIRHLRIELDKARDEMEALKKGEAWT